MTSVCDAVGFRGCLLRGEIADVLTWGDGGHCALHRAPVIPAWTDPCQRQQCTTGETELAQLTIGSYFVTCDPRDQPNQQLTHD